MILNGKVINYKVIDLINIYNFFKMCFIFCNEYLDI